jgi:hypothetical protein
LPHLVHAVVQLWKFVAGKPLYTSPALSRVKAPLQQVFGHHGDFNAAGQELRHI